ncbi:ATP-binding cassette subfamily C protein CydD [Paenibacillus rhizosphaerae]|uniref:ATP-binding cassette subfamily C protein CydD n=1 Tax=Paenibacillus rhizosphaerae TaxID=297318 RepID=A0A839TZC1_9BACL|nr:ABC transporter ATP-binding protein/permease [Paenibacillus rhizosphaerae]MBB3130748.1 ATP-binding cassette subfamily C protein CydD [Paenibacillus rhizosphaerae]
MDKQLLGYKGIKPVFAVMLLLTVLQGVSILIMAKGLAEAVSALFAGAPLSGQTGRIAMFLGAFLLRHGLGLLQQRIGSAFADRTAAEVRGRVLRKLFRLGPRFARTEGTGHLVTLALEGTEKFRKYLELILPRMAGMSIIPWLILAYVFFRDITSGVILLVSMPILIAFMILIGLAARKQAEKQMDTFRVLSNHFVDSLRGLETLKLLGQSREHGASVAKVSDRYRTATMRTLRVAFLSSFALDFFTMLSVAVVAVGLGLRLVNGQLELVTALTVLILAPEYFLPVRQVGTDFHATQDGKEAGAVMQSILDRPAGGPADSDGAPGPGADWRWTPFSRLTLSGVTVQHQAEAYGSAPETDGAESGREAGADRPTERRTDGAGQEERSPQSPQSPRALDSASFEVQGMQTIGIIGASGAGKSTLIDVLGGFLAPDAGEICLNGTPVDSLAGEAWRSQITYIPQHPYLFSSSLLDNIRFYSPEASREEAWQAVEAAGLAGLVRSLPGGLDEPIGAGGRQLSGGQAQRVALARAFLSDRPMILLDEPTAHLDIETEYELKQTMLRLFRGKLVFLATHRLHWMPDMDRVLVMEQGRIVEEGTHSGLLGKGGAYDALIRSQMEGVR